MSAEIFQKGEPTKRSESSKPKSALENHDSIKSTESIDCILILYSESVATGFSVGIKF